MTTEEKAVIDAAVEYIMVGDDTSQALGLYDVLAMAISRYLANKAGATPLLTNYDEERGTVVLNNVLGPVDDMVYVAMVMTFEEEMGGKDDGESDSE